MAYAARIVVGVIELLLGLIVAGIVMPVLWFILRLLNLIPLLLVVFRQMDWLMLGVGLLAGVCAGALAVTWIRSVLAEESRLGTILGAVGGAIGGLASSIMFFPIIVVL